MHKLAATKAEHPLSGDYIETTRSESKMALDSGASIASLQQAARFVDEVCLKHSAEIQSVSLIAIDDTILRSIQTRSDVDTVVDMNLDLFEKFATAENFDLGRLSISFR